MNKTVFASIFSASLIFNLSCSKDSSNDNPPTHALPLDPKFVTALADTSLEKSCASFLEAVSTFTRDYLPGSEFSLSGTNDFDGCHPHAYDGSIYTQTGFSLIKGETKLKLHVTVNRLLDDDNKNFLTSVYITRFKDNEYGTQYLTEVSDLALGENIVHFQKTLDAWATASQKQLTIFGMEDTEFNTRVVSKLAVGNEIHLPGSPGIKVELIPSSTNVGRGDVKFTAVSESYFSENPGSPFKGKRFLLCENLTCLNEGVTYKIRGNYIYLTSKVMTSNEGQPLQVNYPSAVSAEDID
ncbi:MAG: hypothetical protein EOO45_11045 [Flavobacterium sp.]|nr:MAG: hypothetical protein EOO45_11045 [Flavobacterium sp.]